MVDIYTPNQLVRVINDLRTPSLFLLNTFFPNVQTFSTPVISFDLITKGRKLAPFVMPTVQGRPVKESGYTTQTYTPAYVKPKTPLDPSRPFKRKAGEAIGGTLSPAERRDAQIAEALEAHKVSHQRRWEWMAASALASGTVTVSSDDFPAQVVDFQRAGGHSITLSGGSRWGQAGIKPLENIEAWAVTVAKASGVAVTDVVMDPDAWKLFSADADVRAMLALWRGSESKMELGPSNTHGSQFRGKIGAFNIWTYNEVYEADNGSVTPFLASNTVILGSSGIEGTRCFGAIQDPRSGYQEIDIYPSNWIENDPPVEFVMTQSAPLIVPVRPNASLRATVN